MSTKHLIIGLLLLAIASILIQSGIVDAFLLFLVVGAIPGTSISLPPLVMLALLSATIIVFTHWIAARHLYPGSKKVVESQHKTLRKTARRKVTKTASKSPATHRRRYSQLEA